MTRIDKLYSNILSKPGQVHAFRDFVAVIEAFGFRKARSRGSHQSFVHADCPRLLVIQPKGKDANNTKCANSLI